ncbi:unannotated protein [freshwater metagenome]|uniref:Unannotated protein n=1 Tax=freshwater metagenome TaxID=449393 RepID=A0A6J7GFS7_9ZZZZ
MKAVVVGGEVTTGTGVGATVVTAIVVVGAREVVVVEFRGIELDGPSSEVAFGVSSLAEASTLASPDL